MTANGTTARIVLMFLRELLEQLSMGGAPAQQSYGCPMTKCHRTFVAPLEVIQHLLSCPELPNGEFDCDKCNQWHSFPTNEKDWAQWAGWRSQHPGSLHGDQIQRKRSFGSKMREFALRKREPSRKQNAALEPPFKHISMADARPSTSASEAPSLTFTSRPFGHPMVFPGQPAQEGDAPAFPDMGKPMLPAGLPETDGGEFWRRFDAEVCDLPSTVSSVALSSTVDDGFSEPASHNTSQTTLFNPGLGPYPPPTTSAQDAASAMAPQHYLFPTQSPFNAGLAGLAGHQASSSAMSLDESLSVTGPPLSPAELRPPDSGAEHAPWWGPKVEVGTPRPTPPSTGPDACFPIPAPMEGMLTRRVDSGMSTPTSACQDATPYYQAHLASAHSIPRSLSHDTMQPAMAPVFGTPVTQGSQAETLPPQADHGQPGTGPRKCAPETTAEELVCDECQWKPRGVRENLKGYLRKHKNTHKGLRLACDVAGCTKTFSRLDNLKKHKKDKHGIEETGGSAPSKRAAAAAVKPVEPEAEPKRPVAVESEIHGASQDYSMLWPALHF